MAGLGNGFSALLIGDVIDAQRRRAAEDSQVTRRNLVRATFAAIEGLVWLTREHLLASGDLLEGHGSLSEPVKLTPLPDRVRLLIEQAQVFDPDFAVDLSGKGWSRFRTAITIRNRATHPKSAGDLVITELDLKSIDDGFQWIMATCESMMRSANDAAMTHLDDLRELHQKLKEGDPESLALYRSVEQQTP